MGHGIKRKSGTDFLSASHQVDSIHNNYALFCQSAEKKFNFNHLLPENTNIGCEKYYAGH